MLLLIDNYDSFTYNLYQMLSELKSEVVVVRNDQFSLDWIEQQRPSHIVLSPGPGHPRDAGLCLDVIRRFGASTPILGVCLGHQAIGYAFGATVSHASKIVHGKKSRVYHEGRGLFCGIPSPMEAARYHSLVVATERLPSCFAVTARSEEGELMGMRHRVYPIHGVQFHPESFLTANGQKLMANFLGHAQMEAAA